MLDKYLISHPRIRRIFPWFVCGLAALFYSYEYFIRITPSVMSKELMTFFDINGAQFGNLAAFYYYAYDPMQLPVGMLMDKYGPRRLLTVACLFCAFGSALFSVQTYSIAATGRFFVGFGSAFAFVGVLKLATIWLPANRFALVAGLTTALGTFGAMSGEIILTELVSRLGWQQTVIISAFIGVFLSIVIWSVVRDKSHRSRKKEIKSSSSFTSVFHGLGSILSNPQIWINGIIGCLLYLPITAFAELWGNPFLAQAKGFSSIDAATAISMVFLGFALGAITSGELSDKFRRRRLPITLSGLIAGTLSLSLFYFSPSGKWIIFSILFFLGLSIGPQVIVFAIARENTAEKYSGTALAITNLFIMLGGVVFEPAIGYLLDIHAGTHALAHHYRASDFHFALSIIPIGLYSATLLSFFLRETGATSVNNT